MRTAIVYGTKTAETREDDRLKTRLDFDYYFGTVAHRFCAQAVAEYPVTVYGKGEQRKPFISLEDVVEGLTHLAPGDPEDRPDDLTVYNQVTRAISIVEIAGMTADVGSEFDLGVAVEHFENPRTRMRPTRRKSRTTAMTSSSADRTRASRRASVTSSRR